MKLSPVLALAAVTVSSAVQLRSDPTPVFRVSALLRDLQARIVSDGKLEQMSYDKYACWCEETLSEKASEIAGAKTDIKNLVTKIIKLEGELGSHGAEVKQLQKDIAANKESQRVARANRGSTHAEFETDKVETEQCIGALEAAIKVLNGAGTKANFLGTAATEVQLLSVVSGVRSALKRSPTSQAILPEDLSLIRRFVESPADYLGSHHFASAAQVAPNPFGDYAPQSTRIQGVLKAMYDAFASDLEKNNVEEADAEKAHLAYMATKKAELNTLEITLGTQERDEARKTLEKAQSNEELDNTKVQLDEDEQFFDTTKEGCKQKARSWSTRSRLRSEELVGVAKAIDILTDEQNLKVFLNSSTSLVQLSATESGHQAARARAVTQLMDLGRKFHDAGVTKVAFKVKSRGHFDEVIASIDEMIVTLRKEEQEDIEHRDRCERADRHNNNEIEDLTGEQSKASALASRLESEGLDVNTKIGILDGEITSIEGQLSQLLTQRNEEVVGVRQALKDDVDAVALLDRTIVSLSVFYTNNRIPMALIANSTAGRNYTIDKLKAPETVWDGGDYGGRKDETYGIVAIVEMIREDIQKEIETTRKDDATAEQLYEKEKRSLQDSMDAHIATRLSFKKQLGQVEADEEDARQAHGAASEDLQAEGVRKSALVNDCSWVATHFATRRTKRKTEISGLNEAKAYLAGSDDIL